MAAPKKPTPKPSASGLKVSLGNGQVYDTKTKKVTTKPKPLPSMKNPSSTEYDRMLKKVVSEMKKR